MPGATDNRTGLVEGILETLRHIDKMFHRHMKFGLEGLPVTPHQFGMLVRISEHPGLTVSEMARNALMAKSNISEMVDRLYREGLLEKRHDRADARLTMLFVSDEGEKLLKTMKIRHRAVVEAALTGVDDERLAALAEGLELLYTAVTNNLPTGDED